jgi:hypothetical protein
MRYYFISFDSLSLISTNLSSLVPAHQQHLESAQMAPAAAALHVRALPLEIVALSTDFVGAQLHIAAPGVTRVLGPVRNISPIIPNTSRLVTLY